MISGSGSRETRIAREDYVKELKRTDWVGDQERAAAAAGMFAAINTLDRLCRDSYDNFRLLKSLVETDDRPDECEAPDAFAITLLCDLLPSGSLPFLRLKHRILPDLSRFHSNYFRSAVFLPRHESVGSTDGSVGSEGGELTLPTMADDRNLAGLEGFNLEAICSRCGEAFMPHSDSFKGLTKEGFGLYEHAFTSSLGSSDREDGFGHEEVECGGLGEISGGWK